MFYILFVAWAATVSPFVDASVSIINGNFDWATNGLDLLYHYLV
jgi:hypothetical protein